MITTMNRQINHKTMRVVIGLIAISLAPIVYWLADVDQTITSISISYWTNSHDIFVGSLVAVGFFLFAYNGTGEKRDWEFYLSKASCVFATLVATFPTKGFTDENVPPTWVSAIASTLNIELTHIHYGSAALLFFCLITMMWFFSNRALKKGKRYRAYTYRAISMAMALGIVLIYIIGSVLRYDKTIFMVEAWGLTLFGVGWLLAGSYKTEGKPVEPA